MKLTVIGPWGGYPKKNEASSGYLLEHKDFRLLIDCGSGVLSKLQNLIQPEQLDAVLISHYHPDHIADIGVLQHARLIQGFLGAEMSSLPVYGHKLDKPEFEKLTYKNITLGTPYDPDSKIKIGPFEVSFLRTVHPVPCFAMRIEAEGKVMVYTADTSFKEEFIPFSQDADLLVCECNFYANQNGSGAGHMTSTQAGNLAESAGVKQLILTHLPHYGRLSDLILEAGEEYEGDIHLAEQFLTVEI
ncbi:MBL fold metallo-hydrolase [Neobacillus terrae]|uniref:MBL fold metallo-hydrolase n=1 Tax=Neobacillus terrae TaxID=3034837 RepID=UPI00140C137E|nr:MBL fold metallo-hydrolase [Neobacillus terrae]NHM31736.1 MBL fold metallo-hydrolase [Neobacillus terrae]